MHEKAMWWIPALQWYIRKIRKMSKVISWAAKKTAGQWADFPSQEQRGCPCVTNFMVLLCAHILGTINTDAIYRNLHGPVNRIEEYFLHDFNGRQMWSNGFIKIFSSNNVFIFHSSSDGWQFYAALASTCVACKSMSIKATVFSATTSSFH